MTGFYSIYEDYIVIKYECIRHYQEGIEMSTEIENAIYWFKGANGDQY